MNLTLVFVRSVFESARRHLRVTGASVVATANPGSHLQIENGLKACGETSAVTHSIALLAAAYRAETQH